MTKTQEETQIEIQDIQLEAGVPQDTANKSLCEHTQDAQTFLITQAKIMAYVHGTATKMTISIDNYQHPFMINSGAHFSIIARNCLEHHFPNWEKQLFLTKEKNFNSSSGKMTSIGTIFKEIIIPHRKFNIRLNPEFVVLEDAHIQGFLLGTDYQRMCELTKAPVLIFPDFELPFKLYIDEACSQGLGEALHQRPIVGGEPREVVICYISRQLKYSEARYGATQTECLYLVWALEKIHYYLEGAVFKVYTDCTALKSLLNMKTTNRNMLRLQIAIQEYRERMTIIYKGGKATPMQMASEEGHWIISKATQHMNLK
ncbi:hypothetical protein O181_027847 [Austropuccinia psidii MF-1]|uniref:Reverse transcriptase RNase H-like domain-containing protein n=1 Tax=Austropuccinia psidii MF-1 TaxID=1389203 RepID=A0A9Q3CTF0_9BASI|nr:hypothetical protein [Austropuccinia psidii MF-1]